MPSNSIVLLHRASSILLVAVSRALSRPETSLTSTRSGILGLATILGTTLFLLIDLGLYSALAWLIAGVAFGRGIAVAAARRTRITAPLNLVAACRSRLGQALEVRRAPRERAKSEGWTAHVARVAAVALALCAGCSLHRTSEALEPSSTQRFVDRVDTAYAGIARSKRDQRDRSVDCFFRRTDGKTALAGTNGWHGHNRLRRSRFGPATACRAVRGRERIET